MLITFDDLKVINFLCFSPLFILLLLFWSKKNCISQNENFYSIKEPDNEKLFLSESETTNTHRKKEKTLFFKIHFTYVRQMSIYFLNTYERENNRRRFNTVKEY